MFPSVVIVGFLRSVLFGFGVVVEAENPRGIRCFVLLLESLPCVYRNSNFVAFMCRKFRGKLLLKHINERHMMLNVVGIHPQDQVALEWRTASRPLVWHAPLRQLLVRPHIFTHSRLWP